jgi:hypothetical protein
VGKRGGWFFALAALLGAGGTAFFVFDKVVLQDIRHPVSSIEDERSPSLHSHIDLTADPLLGLPRSDASWANLPAILDLYPGAHFQWRALQPGVAHVTLSDGQGKTRLPTLVAEEGNSFEWEGVLPSSSSLEFHTGILSNGPGILFVVELAESGGAPQRIFSTAEFFGSPLLSSPLNSWHLARVDLSAWAGRSVRIRLRAESPPDPSRLGSVVGFWGAPRIWFPVVEPPSKKRRRPPSAPPPSVVLSVLETTPGVGGDLPPQLTRVLRESVSFPRFYTTDVRSGDAFQALLSTGTETASPSAWVRLLKEKGYRTQAVGAFPDERVGALADAGFDAVYQLPHDGYDSLHAADRAMAWAQDRARGPVLIVVFFRDLPRFRWPPARVWANSLGAFPRSVSRLVFWKRATEAAYIDETMGRLADRLNEAPDSPLFATVSLRGSVADPTPVRWLRSGRRGWVFLNERGWGLRESEIRTVFTVRHGDRWPPGLCRGFGQIPDVGPTLLAALGVPVPTGTGRPWKLDAASQSEDSNGRWVLRSPWAKALILDGRYKYILHGPSAPRSDRFGRPMKIDFPLEEIFDLWSDPEERRNLTRSRRHLLARVREVLGELDPTPVDIRLSFLNPTGSMMEGVVTCSAGAIAEAGGTLPIARSGSYQFSFSTTAAAGDLTFRTSPPHSSYSMRLLSDRRSLPSGQIQVSRWGLPLFETVKKEWIDKTEFGWMDGWAPPVPSTVPVASLGRVSVPWADAGRAEEGP